jgi:hypothetical protein
MSAGPKISHNEISFGKRLQSAFVKNVPLSLTCLVPGWYVRMQKFDNGCSVFYNNMCFKLKSFSNICRQIIIFTRDSSNLSNYIGF